MRSVDIEIYWYAVYIRLTVFLIVLMLLSLLKRRFIMRAKRLRQAGLSAVEAEKRM